MTPTIITFRQPAETLNLNQRWHWARKAKVTRTWRTAATWAAKAALTGQTLPLAPSLIAAQIDVRGNLRRDPSNLWPTVKAVIDGLVDAELWPDDNSEWVTTCEPTLRVVPRNRPLEISMTITPRSTP
jgi:crossover junction endodeoxyribonuclease RusA